MRSSRGRGGIWVHAKLPDERGEEEGEREKEQSGSDVRFRKTRKVGCPLHSIKLGKRVDCITKYLYNTT